MKEEFMVVQEYPFARICAPGLFHVASDQTSICRLLLFPTKFNSDTRTRRRFKGSSEAAGYLSIITVRFLGLLCVSLSTDIAKATKLLSHSIFVYVMGISTFQLLHHSLFSGVLPPPSISFFSLIFTLFTLPLLETRHLLACSSIPLFLAANS